MPSKKRSDVGNLPASRAGLNFAYSTSGQQKTLKIRPEFVPILVAIFIVTSVLANFFFK